MGIGPLFLPTAFIKLFPSSLLSISSLLRNIESMRSIFKGLNDILEPVAAGGKMPFEKFSAKVSVLVA